MSNIKLPEDKTLARRLIDSEARQNEKAVQMGYLGRMFGGDVEKPGNIAGLVIILSFVGLVIVIPLGVAYPAIKTDVLVPLLTGLISLALGYLFGKGERH